MSQLRDHDGGLRKIFRDKLEEPDWQPIETGDLYPGVPDMNGCWSGREIWIEFKQTTHWQLSFRPEQVSWIHRRTRAGGLCWIAVRRNWRNTRGRQKSSISDELWVIPGSDIIAAATGGLRSTESSRWVHWSGGPSEWPWGTIQNMLFQGIPTTCLLDSNQI